MAKTTEAKDSKKNTESGAGLMLSKNVTESSFDEIYNLDEKELTKKISYDQKKNGKRLQLGAKLSSIEDSITKAQNQYLMSLTDPTVDSVELKVEISVLNAEKAIAIEIYNQLFPEQKITLS